MDLPPIVRDTELDSQVGRDLTTHWVYDSSKEGEPCKVQEQWKTQRLLGRGGCGTVLLQKCTVGKRLGQLRAVKAIEYDAKVTPSSRIARELETIGRLSQRNYRHRFVRSFGWYKTGSTMFVAMEYLKLGDLDCYLDRPLPETEASLIARQLAEGLKFMHDLGYVHRDLKPKNVLVQCPHPNWYVKIADFGLSKMVEETSSLTVGAGTPNYMAPEVLQEMLDVGMRPAFGQHAFAMDMWALGIVVFQMVTSEFPFRSWSDLRLHIASDPSESLVCDRLSADCASFVQKALTVSAAHRLTSRHAIEHPWILTGRAPTGTSATPSPNKTREEEEEAQGLEVSSVLDSSWQGPWGTWTTSNASGSISQAVGPGTIIDKRDGFIQRDARTDNSDNQEHAVPELGLMAPVNNERHKTAPLELENLNKIPRLESTKQDRDIVVKLPSHSYSHAEGLYHRGRYAEAEEFYREAAFGCEKTLGAEHPDTLKSFDGLSRSLHEQGKFAEAEEHCRRVLSGRMKIHGAQHIKTLVSYQNLGNILFDQGKFALAEEQYRVAYSGRNKTLGPEHVDTLVSVHNLGMALHRQEKFLRAESHFRLAALGNETAKGPDHLMLGEALYMQKKWAEAEEQFQLVASKRTRLLGADDVNTLEAVSSLGKVQLQTNNLSEARKNLLHAATRQKQTLGAEHKDTLSSIDYLAECFYALAEWSQAKTYSQLAALGRDKALGTEHVKTIKSVSLLGLALFQLGKHAEAEEQLQRAVLGLSKISGPEDIYTLYCFQKLGQCQYIQGKYQQAEEQFQRAAVGRLKNLGSSHKDTRFSFRWLSKANKRL